MLRTPYCDSKTQDLARRFKYLCLLKVKPNSTACLQINAYLYTENVRKITFQLTGSSAFDMSIKSLVKYGLSRVHAGLTGIPAAPSDNNSVLEHMILQISKRGFFSLIYLRR